MNKVWYLSYGSNLSRERFLCYIKGTQYKDNARCEQGCRDNRLPMDDRTIIIQNELFFSFKIPQWQNMGVAFIRKQKSNTARTFCRMYLLTQEQFEDVVKQENDVDVNQNIEIDYDRLNEVGHISLFEDSYYGSLLKIDEVDSLPVYTFTLNHEPVEYMQPSREYLRSIINGIKNSHSPSCGEIAEAFIRLKGIDGHYTYQELLSFVESI